MGKAVGAIETPFRFLIALLVATMIVSLGCSPDEAKSKVAGTVEQGDAMTDHTLSIDLSPDLDARLTEEASRLGMSREERVGELLEYGIAPAENLVPGFIPESLKELERFLSEIPGVDVISTSDPGEARWWVKMQIEIRSNTAWHVVQNLAFVLNGISIDEPLPTTFKPTSPPPYLNGGPDEFLFWVIEADIPLLNPSVITALLKERLPHPVDDPDVWLEE